ncbi:sensor histidine kinase [Reichenbachiella versicolor]|uniref:sensor histidine kinase n=1 Tax=Reichenbachiella versicolor TaxID=1821036 RepID=UPI000D6E002B|nr:ATP-binding protein [Reichenbachiella versicolor]
MKLEQRIIHIFIIASLVALTCTTALGLLLDNEITSTTRVSSFGFGIMLIAFLVFKRNHILAAALAISMITILMLGQMIVSQVLRPAGVAVLMLQAFCISAVFENKLRIIMHAMVFLMMAVVFYYLNSLGKVTIDHSASKGAMVNILIVYGLLASTTYFLKRNYDVTLKRQRKAQHKMIESEKMSALGTLITGLCHELNNPLNFIKGGLEILNYSVDKGSVNEQTKKSMNIIGEGVDRTLKLVQILSFFSYSPDKPFTRIDLKDTIQNCLALLKGNSSAYIQIDFNFHSKTPYIFGNRQEIHQAIINILLNAVQSIKKHGNIYVEVFLENGYHNITIKDNGSGIAPSVLGRVMEPFYTTKAPGKGTGLGLSTTHSIISTHQGTINIDSNLGEGTTVTIKLPFQEDQE